jgi:hypothetical protein
MITHYKNLKICVMIICKLANEAEKQQEIAQKDNASNFYLRIKEVCKLGASNYRTAIRWILEADELEHDFAYEGGYLVWEYNLAYKHKKLFKTSEELHNARY